MVKKRMAMRMVTIFVALIVCGMFFPGLARGLSVPNFDEDPVKVEVGESEIIFVTITNESNSEIRIWVSLNPEAECVEDFSYPGYPDSIIYPAFDSDTKFGPGDTFTVEVTFTPSDFRVCTALLTIMPLSVIPADSNVESVTLTLAAEGIPESADNFEPILMDGVPTNVMNRSIEIDAQTTSTLQEMIDECVAKFEKRGQLMRRVAWLTGELCRAGDITRKEKRELRRKAARLEWERIIKNMKARKKTRNGHRGGGRYWWLCRDR
jgi:hypothetical protein